MISPENARRMAAAAVGSTPSINAAALHAFKNPPPAMVQPADMSQEQFKSEGKLALLNAEKAVERFHDFVDQFKKRWKDFGETRDIACQSIFGIAWETLKKRLQRLEKRAGTFCPGFDPEQDKQDSLTEVSNLPDPTAQNTTTEEGSETESTEPEKPTPPPKPEPVKDKSGIVVPARCLPLTARRKEVTEMEYHASKLASLFEKLQSNNDALYSQLRASGNVQTYMNHANTMRYTISHCIPDVVCPACKGDGKARTVVKDRDWCHECAGSGMISEVKWNREWVKSTDRAKLAEVERRRNGS